MTNPNTAPVEQVDHETAQAILGALDAKANVEQYASLVVLLSHHRLAATAPLQARVEEMERAAQEVLDMMFSTYKAKNGRDVGIQGDDGEKVWLVHSDQIEGLRQALSTTPATSRLAELEAAVRKLGSAIDTARDLVPDEDEGLAAQIFTQHLNAAQVEANAALNPEGES